MEVFARFKSHKVMQAGTRSLQPGLPSPIATPCFHLNLKEQLLCGQNNTSLGYTGPSLDQELYQSFCYISRI